ncbi:MAG: hypothetical protein AAF607_11800 [Pseudomonadota bacterium]
MFKHLLIVLGLATFTLAGPAKADFDASRVLDRAAVPPRESRRAAPNSASLTGKRSPEGTVLAFGAPVGGLLSLGLCGCAAVRHRSIRRHLGLPQS